MADVVNVLRSIPAKGDAVVLMGDFNARLPRSVGSLTGRYCRYSHPDEGGELLVELMQQFELHAVSTSFKPKKLQRRLGSCTYLPKDPEHPPAQLDYVLVSSRWRSCVLGAEVKWGPSIHRWGHKWDHGMVCIRWKARVRVPPPRKAPFDLQRLEEREVQQQLDEKVREHLVQDRRLAPWPYTAQSVDEEFGQMGRVVRAAMEESVPKMEKSKGKVRKRSPESMKLFEDRAKQCEGLEPGSDELKQARQSFQKKIFKACRQDYRVFVSEVVDEMQAAADKGDSKTVARLVHKVCGTGRSFCSRQPAKSKNGAGELFQSPQELADAWGEMASSKFAATEAESARGSMPDIGSADGRTAHVPEDADLDTCLAAMGKCKAVDIDEIAAEMYKSSKVARKRLYSVVKRCWREECVPEEMACGLFVTVFKNKGSSDDMTKYRFLCLLTHAFKLLSSYLLFSMLQCIGGFLPESQAGFRKHRGTRDNIYLLASLMDEVLRLESTCVVTYIDFVAAFDSCSHHFLDEAIGEALEVGGGEPVLSAKCRAMFRALYESATARVRVRAADGQQVLSEPFDVSRGVVQGDVFSPLAFIICLQVLLNRYGGCGSSLVVSIGGVEIGTLAYADDAALLQWDVRTASERVSALCAGSRRDADMQISVPKTEVQHVAPVCKVTVDEEGFRDADALKTLKFKCDCCNHPGFKKKGALNIHKARYCGASQVEVFADEYLVEAVVDARGPPEHRYYLVRWVGDWGDDKETWEPYRHLANCSEAVDRFWVESGLDKASHIRVPGEHRCQYCNQNFASGNKYLKGHLTKKANKGGCALKPRSLVGTAAHKAVVRHKKMSMAAQNQTVSMEGKALAPTFCFKYLGFEFDADGDRGHAVAVSMAKAGARFRQMAKMWAHKHLSLRVKLRLFEAAVVSILVYGSEAWVLGEKVMVAVNAWCARCTAYIIAGQFDRDTLIEECKRPTFDLVGRLRHRRLRWLGEVLQREESFLVRQVVVVQAQQILDQQMGAEGTIFMDAPKHKSVEELIQMANRGRWWTKYVNKFKPTDFNTVVESEDRVLRFR